VKKKDTYNFAVVAFIAIFIAVWPPKQAGLNILEDLTQLD
jgi:hypothetical protein